MDDIYQEIILERYKDPHNRGEVKGNAQASQANMLCGDKLIITAKIEKGKVIEAKFSGGGCAISMAAADLLLDRILGMDLEEVRKISGDDVEKMLGVELTPARKKCACLVLETLKKI